MTSSRAYIADLLLERDACAVLHVSRSRFGNDSLCIATSGLWRRSVAGE